MTTKNLLRILFVEDLSSDVDLAVLELQKEGLRFEYLRIDARNEFIKALKKFIPDIVISDFMMPSYNGMQALKDSREFDPLLPFILFTGSMNEEIAVECIKAGATDYIIKEHMTRLPFAVKEALEQHRRQIEKRAAELLLRENEEKLQSIFSAAPVGIGLVVNRVFMEVNDTFCKITGYTRKELIGKSSELIYATKEEYEIDGAEKYNQISEKGMGSVETRIKCKNGKILNILLGSAPLDKNDLTKGVSFTVMNITERIQAEKALQENEEKFRSIMENSADAIFITDQQGRYLYTNKAVTEMLGFTSEEMRNKTIMDITPKNETDKYLKLFKQVLSEGKVFTEIELLKKDGNFISTDLNSVLLPDGQVYGSCRDITDRKHAEEELKQSYAFTESLLKTIPFGMDIVDESGTILFQSDNFRGLFGDIDREKKCWELYRDDKKQCSDCPLKLGITVGETKAYESYGVLGNRIFEINHTGMMYQGKKAMFEIFQDITERKANEEELIRAKEKAEESDKLKTAFLHNISHEIRTPMNAIVGFSALLGEPEIDDQLRKSYIEIIVQSSDHLLSIITDIVDISNIEANLIKTFKNEINVNSTLRSLCNQFIPRANEKKINLICETGLSDSGAMIITDSTKLTQILSNLLSNALKFTEKGYIKIWYSLKENFLEFCVSDSGIGISPEHHARIFDRFYQVQSTMERLYEGTGLGLAISKAYVEHLGGKIWFTSEPGKGTSFFFTIPYEKQVSTTTSVAERKAPDSFVFPVKKVILVAEDVESNFKLIRYFLSGSNAEVLHAYNGKEAVEKCLSVGNIDLILMDIKMPVMDGYTAVKLIREKNTTIPIIAQTAYADDMEKAIECGCSGFISKPFDKKSLLKVLCEFI
jgi:PAS domain S-box-containing protein